MSTRAMRWWDVEAVLALEHELFPGDPWSAEQFWGELAHVPETRWFVVHEDSEGIDGYAGLNAVPPQADVQTIAVAPRSQGTGLGRRLLTGLLAEAERRGCGQVFLEVRADNAPAQSLYSSMGFEVTGRRRDYYGNGIDAVLMRCRLGDRESAS